jgi:hypothetical protein
MCVRAAAVDGSAIALAAHAKPIAAALQFIDPPSRWWILAATLS